MSTQLTNVTPTATPRATLAGRSPRNLIVVALAVLLLIVVANRLLHHANRYEKLANSVTKAIAANDMRPVEGEFNALRRPALADRGKVGRLSDFVNRDGAFKYAKEDTPANSAPNYHQFVAHFEKGDLKEDLTVDEEGKIAAFHVVPLSSQ